MDNEESLRKCVLGTLDRVVHYLKNCSSEGFERFIKGQPVAQYLSLGEYYWKDVDDIKPKISLTRMEIGLK